MQVKSSPPQQGVVLETQISQSLDKHPTTKVPCHLTYCYHSTNNQNFELNWPKSGRVCSHPKLDVQFVMCSILPTVKIHSSVHIFQLVQRNWMNLLSYQLATKVKVQPAKYGLPCSLTDARDPIEVLSAIILLVKFINSLTL